MMRVRAVILLSAAVLGPPLAAQAPCAALGQTSFVGDVMRRMYYWSEEMPSTPPAFFDSADAYLDYVRYAPLDKTFSYISDRAADDAFFSDSQFIGLGLSTKLLGNDLKVAEVYPESPASEAGLERGARFLAIAGRSVSDYLAKGDLGSAFGPTQIGYSVAVLFQDRAGSVRSATMLKRLVTIPSVSLTRVFEVDGRRVGYIHFRNFVTPATDALTRAFTSLKAAGASELVLDLRYNGGGLVSVAQHLANLIGGNRTAGQVFAVFFHNERNADLNQTLRYENNPAALDLSRLTVITTRASASASELVINAARPFLKVTIVGDTTYGKPVGQYSYAFCDRVLHPVAFQLRNAQNQGDFFDGFPPDCPAADDIDHLLGDPAEASLGEALFAVKNGACSAGTRSAATASALRAARSSVRETGWRAVLNAQ